MTILNKRIQYLAIADIDYLSARLLLICGIPFTGLPKAAEAMEKIFKLFLMLEAKITGGKELNDTDLKKYSHRLTKLFNVVKKKIPAHFDNSWDEFIEELELSYKRRYPDTWPLQMKWSTNFKFLDSAYSYIREGVMKNFPYEEQEKVKKFGVNILSAYNADIITTIKISGGIPPIEILKINNSSFAKFTLPE